MQHRLYDCYWQMRMPEIADRLGGQRRADRVSHQAGRGRRDRRSRPEALRRTHHASDIASPSLALALSPRPRWRSRSARSGAAPTPRSRPRSRPRRPTGRSRLTGDETMQQCSAHAEQPAKDVADAIQKREMASDRLSARQQLHRRLEEGRGAGAIRLRPALHRLSGAASQWRQLLRLPSAHQEGSELRHARAEPVANTASCATSSRRP